MIVVVPTCAAFADTWTPFATLFMRYWRDRPVEWPVHVVTDRGVDGVPPGLGTAHAEDDPSWSRRLRWFLTTQVPRERVVLMLQDDFFLMGHVNTKAVQAAADLVARRPDVGAVRLNPCPGPVDEWPVETAAGVPLGEVKPGEPYRVSCQATVWSVGFLLAGLATVPQNEGSPSDFEFHATRAAVGWHYRVLCVTRSHGATVLPYFTTAVISGKWHPDALALCAREGVTVRSTRPVLEG